MILNYALGMIGRKCIFSIDFQLSRMKLAMATINNASSDDKQAHFSSTHLEWRIGTNA